MVHVEYVCDLTYIFVSYMFARIVGGEGNVYRSRQTSYPRWLAGSQKQSFILTHRRGTGTGTGTPKHVKFSSSGRAVT